MNESILNSTRGLGPIKGKESDKKEFSAARFEPDSPPSCARVFRLRIYSILILVSGGLIFGRIMATDSIPDRTIQEYRLAQIQKTLQKKGLELRRKGVSDERIRAELRRVGKSLLADAKKERPTLSANDRSRWLTIRALVEPESRVYRYLPLDAHSHRKPFYSAGEVRRNDAANLISDDSSDRPKRENFPEKSYLKEWVPYAIDKGMETPGWETIDMVKHGLSDEEYDPADPFSGYLYSSKPTLLPTLMAVPYWLIYQTTGLSCRDHPFFMTRFLLVIYNLIPLMFGWFLMTRLIERFGRNDFGGEEISESGGNRAVSQEDAESAQREKSARETADWSKIFAVAVLCFATFLSTFAVTLNNHLPGVVAIIIALYAAVRILVDGEPKRRYFFIAALFGSLAVACEIPAILIAGLICLALLRKFPLRTIFVSLPAALAVIAAFFGTNYIAHGSFRQAYAHKRDHIALAKAENPDAADGFKVTTFDPNDWYVYRYFPSGAKREAKNARLSYWSDRQGIDRGEESRGVYALHALVGHHGLFSLTPVWILSVVGLFFWLFKRKGAENVPVTEIRLAGGAILAATLFFFVFYIMRDQGDRNYGGMTCGLRWFFPLIPFWILSMLPVLNILAKSRPGRTLALVLIFISAMSVSYPLWNPWSPPWFMNLMTELGWVGPF